MDSLTRYVAGDFRPSELKRYLGFEAVVFWGLIFICWTVYPSENKYSIMTHTFSFLGSFEAKHNPRGWWLFSMAMFFWGSATVPVVRYLYRRFATISVWGACVGALLFLAGCVGIMTIALFPDARGKVIGHFEWTHIHEKAALLVAAGFGLGIPWHGILLLKDRLIPKNPRGGGGFRHGRFIWPYLVWTAVFGVGMYFQIKWEFVYADMKAAAAAAGTQIGSHWSEALNTRYSFPLWENLVIYTLFVFLLWFTLAMPNEIPRPNMDGASR